VPKIGGTGGGLVLGSGGFG
jgi:hypothetical protein